MAAESSSGSSSGALDMRPKRSLIVQFAASRKACQSNSPPIGSEAVARAISGKWYNELNSWMEIQVQGNILTGKYHGSAGPAGGDFKLSGVIDGSPMDSSQALAWVVTWIRSTDGQNFHAVTAWSGFYQRITNPKTRATADSLAAQWFLTSKSDPGDPWPSTKVGHDVFFRAPTSEPMVQRRMKWSARSHPGGKGPPENRLR